METAVRVGNPAEAILEQTLARQADLIVMSTHGSSGLAHWALGSVAEGGVRAPPVPGPFIPDVAPATLAAPDGAGTPRILVSLDGSAGAEAALRPAIEVAPLLEAEVFLLYVFTPRLRTIRYT